MKIENENSIERLVRITLICAVVILGLICCLNIPEKKDINGIKNEIVKTDQQIRSMKEKVRTNSPIRQDNSFNLIESETNCQKKIKHGLELTFGGLKNKDDFTKLKPEVVDTMGKKFANFYCIYNDGTKYLKNDFVDVYFSDIDNIHAAEVFAFTQYQVRAMGKNIPISIGFLIDYDLEKQKVNNYKSITMKTNDVINYEGSNL